MFCGHCGVRLPPDAKFCGACGGPVLSGAGSPQLDAVHVAPTSGQTPVPDPSTAVLEPEKSPSAATQATGAPRFLWPVLCALLLAVVCATVFLLRRPSSDRPSAAAAPAASTAAPLARTKAESPAAATSRTEAECFDISRQEPHSLHGTLVGEIFAGRPNYTDVRKGDDPEPAYILKLRDSICVRSDDADIPSDPSVRISEVQLFAQDQEPAISAAMRSLLGLDVQVQLTSITSATTGHDHAPLVAGARSITIEDSAVANKVIPRVIPPQTQDGDQSEEVGTAVTTVRAFYDALSFGDGEAASAMVVPEKRASGPYAPDSISRFYGPMPEPLTLTQITLHGPGEYLVGYQFRMATRSCHGRAIVTTIVRDEMNLIERIQSLDGC